MRLEDEGRLRSSAGDEFADGEAQLRNNDHKTLENEDANNGGGVISRKNTQNEHESKNVVQSMVDDNVQRSKSFEEDASR